MSVESATLQIKFTQNGASKTNQYQGISVNATDEQCIAFAEFLGTLTNGANVASVTKVIKREITLE